MRVEHEASTFKEGSESVVRARAKWRRPARTVGGQSTLCATLWWPIVYGHCNRCITGTIA